MIVDQGYLSSGELAIDADDDFVDDKLVPYPDQWSFLSRTGVA
jgi:hypothetical protein